MSKQKRARRAVSLGLVLAMTASNFAWAAESPAKEETVYVILDRNGSVKDITVSDWLHDLTPGEPFEDVSTLEEIRNVKGKETPRRDGSRLVWETDGEELYYQGKTRAPLPLSFDLRCRLDGEDISLEKLAGVSGNLEISLEIENRDSHEVQVRGETRTLYTPFAAVAVLNFPTRVFEDLEVNTGKVVNDGSNYLVTYAALPGLRESLDLADEDFNETFDLPRRLVIEGRVRNFEMGDVLITAETDADILRDLGDFDDVIEETLDGVDDLRDASEEVRNGLEVLDEGAWELEDKFGAFSEGMGIFGSAVSLLGDSVRGPILEGSLELAEGAESFREKTEALKDGTEDLQEGTESLEEGVRAACGGAGELKEGSRAMVQGMEAFEAAVLKGGLDTDSIAQAVARAVETAVDQAAAGALQSRDDWTDAQRATLEAAASAAGSQAGEEAGEAVQAALEDKLSTMTATLAGGLSQLLTGARELDAGIGALKSGLAELLDGAGDLKDGMEVLDEHADLFRDGAGELSEGALELSEGLEELEGGVSELERGARDLGEATREAGEGIGLLHEGTDVLSEGYETFENEGVDELHSKVREKTDAYYEFYEIKDRLALLADSCDTYSGIAEEMEGSVKFVFKIDGVEPEEAAETVQIIGEEKPGFFDWLKRSWHKLVD